MKMVTLHLFVATICTLFFTCSFNCENVDEISGHLKPLGSHRPPISGGIDVVHEFPHPEEFYEKYVKASRPVIFKQMATVIPAYNLWTDEYLSKNYGDMEVVAETGKKEDRSNPVWETTLGKFIERYGHDNVYLVQDLLSADVGVSSMIGDMRLPKSLQCGNFDKALVNVIIWFSSGGTNSVVHTDSLDNINCLLSGRKQLFMVDQKYKLHEMFDKAGSHSGLDIEKVDMIQYPEYRDVPWYNVTMETGDCLFIPYHWLHNVKSSNTRNMAVNLWFDHIPYFNKTDCEGKNLEEVKPMNDIPIASIYTLFRFSLLRNLLGSNKDKFTREEFMAKLSDDDDLDVKNHTQQYEETFNTFDLNHDGLVTMKEAAEADISKLEKYLNQDDFKGGYSKDEL
ncbi:Uncharacterised protein at_DN0820 [Pycnogonum litorale]